LLCCPDDKFRDWQHGIKLASQFEEWMNSQTDLEQKMNLNNPWLGYRETAYSDL
jgi:hypothetical protein